jgi:hypothetical protein
LLPDLVEKGIFGEQRHGGKAADPECKQRQGHMPGIIDDFSEQAQLLEIVRGKAAQGKPAVIAPARK